MTIEGSSLSTLSLTHWKLYGPPIYKTIIKVCSTLVVQLDVHDATISGVRFSLIPLIRVVEDDLPQDFKSCTMPNNDDGIRAASGEVPVQRINEQLLTDCAMEPKLNDAEKLLKRALAYAERKEV